MPDSRQPAQEGGKQLRSRLKDLRQRLGAANAEWSPGTLDIESSGASYAARLEKLFETDDEPEPRDGSKPAKRRKRRR